MKNQPAPDTDALVRLGLIATTSATHAIQEIERQRDKALAEAKMWKANHDNQVKLKATLMDRPDLADRALRMQQLITERNDLLAEIERLKVAINTVASHLTDCNRIQAHGEVEHLNPTRTPQQ